MLLNTPELREDCKKIAKARVTATGLVCPNPAFIYAILITAKSDNSPTAHIYDGQSAVDDFFITFRGVSTQTNRVVFDTPMFFSKGIYVDVDGDTEAVIIHYLPIKE